jgi:hypothetical protein
LNDKKIYLRKCLVLRQFCPFPMERRVLEAGYNKDPIEVNDAV